MSRSLAALVDLLGQGRDVVDLLDQVVHRGVELLAADAAGILLGDGGGRLRVAAVSSDHAPLVELLALDTEDSPCAECFRGAVEVQVPDLGEVRSRWPEFAVAVNRAGAFQAVHALPMVLRGEAVGVLVLLRDAPGPLLDDDLVIGRSLAGLATIGLMTEGSVRPGDVAVEQMRGALADRVAVERATGVLAQQSGSGVADAFARLREHGAHQEESLSESAHRIVARELDPASIAPRPEGLGKHRSGRA